MKRFEVVVVQQHLLDRVIEMDSNVSAVSRTNVTELTKNLQTFSTVDGLIFIVMLLMCLAIGLYFGFADKNKKQIDAKRTRSSAELDYLVGGRKMSIFPTAMSLLASWISGISLLGVPMEIYVYGTQFMYMNIAMALSFVINNYVFIPVYVELKLTSVNEYLEKRFDNRLRSLSSAAYILVTLMWLPIVIYAPALAFNQVTGINIHWITPITCVVCIFYTSIGGMKAVIWTDVIQTFIMYGTSILILVKGTIAAGGVQTVLEINRSSGRLEYPELTMDFTVRHSLPAILIGGTIYYTQFMAIQQSFIQRFLSLPDLKAARKTLLIFGFSIILLSLIFMATGLVIYATYHECDPITTKLAKAPDQLVPVLVMDLFNNLPGLTGLFTAGIFSAGLSSLSTALNSLSAVILEDFVKRYSKAELSSRTKNIVMRGIVVLTGVICVLLVFVVERLGSVLNLSIVVGSCASGPLFAIFLMGLLVPFINGKNALLGGIGGLICMIWIAVRAQTAKINGELVFPEKPVSTNGCLYDFIPPDVINATSLMHSYDGIPPIHHVSYLFYVSIGTIITLIISFASIVVLGRNNIDDVDPMLIAPFIRTYWYTSRVKNSEVVAVDEVLYQNNEHNVPKAK